MDLPLPLGPTCNRPPGYGNVLQVGPTLSPDTLPGVQCVTRWASVKSDESSNHVESVSRLSANQRQSGRPISWPPPA